MPKRCKETECMQPNPQPDDRFRVSTISGIRNHICIDCEAELDGKCETRKLKFMTLEQWRRENGR